MDSHRNSPLDMNFFLARLSHSVATYFFVRQRSRTVSLPQFATQYLDFVFLAGVAGDNQFAERTLI